MVYDISMMLKSDVQVRFWKLVDKQADCWLWTGVLAAGYGQFSNTGGSKAAHRAAYEFLVGEIPKGLHLHHTCYQRNCVNPAHLLPVTPSDHTQLHKIRHVRGRRKENKIMITVRLSPLAKQLLRDLAGSMGLSQSSVLEVAMCDLAAMRK